MVRRLEYPTPRIGIFIRLTPTDILTLKAESRRRHKSVNRIIEEAIHDWINLETVGVANG